MRPFIYVRAADEVSVVEAFGGAEAEGPPTAAESQFIAGGTTILDLMKLDVMRPSVLIDLNGIEGLKGVEQTSTGLKLGALARMADVAAHPLINRQYPVIAQSLALAASAQLRNMATLGGNVLQRTRCSYFRDLTWGACNKRRPGSGCAALDGFNRMHAVLGVSPNCIATYPGDFAQALIALDAAIEIRRGAAHRIIPFAELHRLPADRPDVETTLAPDEVIVAFLVPKGEWTRRSLFLKIRDRESYEFALASAAVALDMPAGRSGAPRAHRPRRGRHRSLAGARGGGSARWPGDHHGNGSARRGSRLRRGRAPPAQRLQDCARPTDAGPRALRGRDNGDLRWPIGRPRSPRLRPPRNRRRAPTPASRSRAKPVIARTFLSPIRHLPV